jgi:hypothetical protein
MKGAAMNTEGAKTKGQKPRPGGKGRDPVAAILGKRPSGKQLRETLAETLPIMKAKRKAPAKIGRPSKYTEETGMEILGLMASGFTVTEAADRLGIDRGTVYRWAERNPSFASILARAKGALAEHAFTQAASIPRELYQRVQAGETIDGPTVAAARLYSDSMRWYAEKLNAAAYGPQTKQSIELTGKDGGPIRTASLVIDSRSLSPDAREALRAALEAAASAPPMIEGEVLDESDT